MIIQLALAILCSSSRIQGPEGIDAARLQAHVERLTSADFDGRQLGTAGGDKAAQYLLDALQSYALKAGGNLSNQAQPDYRQSFTMQRYEHMFEPKLVMTKTSGGDQDLVYGRDFLVNTRGLMRSTERLEIFRYDTLGLSAEVARPDRALFFSLGTNMRKRLLEDRGLLKPGSWGLELRAQELSKAGTPFGLPYLRFELQAPEEEQFEMVTLLGDVASDLNWLGFSHVQLFADERRSEVSLANLIAVLPGSDPALAGQSVLVQVFYDHWPRAASDSGQPERGIQGAGAVAAMLEVARVLGQGEAPARSVVLLFCVGQDQRQVGLTKYLNRPTLAHEGVVAALSVVSPGIALDLALAPEPGVPISDFELTPLGAACQAAALPVVANAPIRGAQLQAYWKLKKADLPAQIWGAAISSAENSRLSDLWAPMDYVQLKLATQTLLAALRIASSAEYTPSPSEPKGLPGRAR